MKGPIGSSLAVGAVLTGGTTEESRSLVTSRSVPPSATGLKPPPRPSSAVCVTGIERLVAW